MSRSDALREDHSSFEPLTMKQRQRAEIDQQVAEYLARGGVIHQATVEDNAGVLTLNERENRKRINRDIARRKV